MYWFLNRHSPTNAAEESGTQTVNNVEEDDVSDCEASEAIMKTGHVAIVYNSIPLRATEWTFEKSQCRPNYQNVRSSESS